MNALTNYLSAGLLGFGLLLKSPDLLRHRHDPYLRSLCTVLGLAGLCFVLGAPPTIGAVNRISGIPNLAAPVTYVAITAYSAASQVLVVRWRGGPGVRRTTRRWVLAYACVVTGIVTMFALGDAPVERRTDLDTYYANTPYIREMILLYLLAHLTAVAVTTVSSLRWARRVDGWLRAGLVTLGIGTLCGAGYSVIKLVAVAARWGGLDWSALDRSVSPAAAGLGALVTVIGILIPLAGPRLTRWRQARRTYRRLEPLERELDDLLVRRALRLPRPRWASPVTRLVWRQTSIHNALSHLDAYVDRELYDETLREALRATGDPRRAAARAWATVIAAAVREASETVAAEPVAAGSVVAGSVVAGPLVAGSVVAGPAAAESGAAAGPVAEDRFTGPLSDRFTGPLSDPRADRFTDPLSDRLADPFPDPFADRFPDRFPDRAPDPDALVDIADALADVLATAAPPHGADGPQPVPAARGSRV
ncbi:MAB_1171c family putative transporter [Streptomyces sp. NPDC052687]|uniref:MAB_1171c family putative transporter n=1 Tax=Streptomyces sp. NPDC052687 TaxID=3154759 RepID=UPI003433141E